MGPLDGKRVLDLGSGTGILAIAAVKLGAREVVAVDPEEGAYEAAVRNITLNGVKDRIKVIKEVAEAVPAMGLKFDLVLANLYGDLLLGLAPRILPLMEKGGSLILSGMTYEFSSDVKTAFAKAGFVVERSRALENFCTLVMKAA
jgi:ribosomal protein L11 methyltransferase